MTKNLMLVTLLAAHSISSAATTVGPAWAWDAGKITHNGSVQIKSTNGTSTYSAVQNPTGAVAKANQSALTQPPTVIIQATSGSVFNYTTDCWVFSLMSADGYTNTYIGAGKVDSSNRFTGLFGKAEGGSGYSGGMIVLGMLTGYSGYAGYSTSSGIADPKWCDNSNSCIDGTSRSLNKLFMAKLIPITSPVACF